MLATIDTIFVNEKIILSIFTMKHKSNAFKRSIMTKTSRDPIKYLIKTTLKQ